LQLRRFVAEHPQARGVILQAHGLVTWGDTQEACYQNTLDVINRAAAWLAASDTEPHPFGAVTRPAAAPAQRADVAAALMPVLRGMVSVGGPKVGHFDDSAAVLELVTREQLQPLAAIGTSCPDHFLRTKICPLVLSFDPARESVRDVIARLPAALDAYRAHYSAYYDRCKRAGSPPMRDPSPVVCLVQGVGMLTFAADKATARVSAEFYTNAINVMREAARVSTYCGLPEQEAFNIEYWQLEEDKLRRLPKPRPLSGRVALITGGAGGIGQACARRLLVDGAHVILCDVDRPALEEVATAMLKQYGADTVRTLWMDVTDESAVLQAYREAVLQYGGIDICVSNAGIASAAPVEDTTLELWNRSFEILSTGYFLVAREAFRCMKAQGGGGSIVFVGSKNALVASAGAAAYCTAKAAELHLARCLAVEGAPHRIRVNVVNPDAVLRGSRIWQGEWAEQRAEQHHTTVDGLETVYRERSLLKENVYPEDIAEAIAFFASPASGKSTGNILNVDAGNAAAFTR
jgi:rhamnulose-1-phosphate aldolase/alcohol dehydrogenase